MLENCYGKGNVEQLNSSTSFAVKIPENIPFSEIQEKIGFSKTSKNNVRGIIVEMLSGYHDGWYSRDFWDFLKKEIEPIEPKE